MAHAPDPNSQTASATRRLTSSRREVDSCDVIRLPASPPKARLAAVPPSAAMATDQERCRLFSPRLHRSASHRTVSGERRVAEPPNRPGVPGTSPRARSTSSGADSTAPPVRLARAPCRHFACASTQTRGSTSGIVARAATMPPPPSPPMIPELKLAVCLVPRGRSVRGSRRPGSSRRRHRLRGMRRRFLRCGHPRRRRRAGSRQR